MFVSDCKTVHKQLHVVWLLCRCVIIIFRPENGSPSATNVVLVVLVLVVISAKAFFISTPIVVKLRMHLVLGDNIIHNRTATDFQVNSSLV